MSKIGDPDFNEKALDFISKNTKAACPVCANEEWVLARDDAGYPRTTVVTAIKEDGTFMNIPALSLVCNSCGFVRQHDLVLISLRMANSNE